MQDPTSGNSESALNAALSWGGRSFAVLLKARKRVLAYVAICAGMGTVIALVVPNQYTSAASFIAQGSSSLNLPAALQGAAATLGLERGNDYSPKFYADLLTSRPILQSAIAHQYQIAQG